MKGRIVGAILLSMLLASCALGPSHSEIVRKELEDSAQKYVGKSADSLLINKGAPDFKEKLSTGEYVWTYRKSKAGNRRGMTVTMGNPGTPLLMWTETVNFIIGTDGIVKSFSTSID